MKKIFIYFFAFLFICFIFPALLTKREKETSSEVNNIEINDTSKVEENAQSQYEYKKYGTIKLLHQKTGEVEEVNLDTYLCNVVSAEMPADYEKEALKAQAVVARTYTIYKIENKKHDNADICDSSTCCQAWVSKETRLERWEESKLRSIKRKAGQLALYAQDDRSVAAVGAHQIAGAFLQGGAVPCRRIDKAIQGADAVHTLIPAQIPDLPAVGGKLCLSRAGGLPVIRGGVGFGRGLNGPEHQRPDQRSNRGQRKHDAQFLEPLEHFLPLGGTLGLLHGPAAGSGGAGPVGAAKPAVYPQGRTGPDGQ